jgi:hypothetical protein
MAYEIDLADRPNAFTLAMGHELVEVLVLLPVDEIAGRCPVPENATQIRRTRVTGSSS